MTNLETEKSKLLQVVLFGQPELDRHLGNPAVRQLRQRITFAYTLAPMDLAAVSGYLTHRLAVAGYCGDRLFDARVTEYLPLEDTVVLAEMVATLMISLRPRTGCEIRCSSATTLSTQASMPLFT